MQHDEIVRLIKNGPSLRAALNLDFAAWQGHVSLLENRIVTIS